MKGSFVFTTLVLVVFFGSLIACKKEDVTTNTDTVVTLTGATSNGVEVHFKGLMAHVVGKASGKKDRTVILRHSSHLFTIKLPDSVNVAELEAAIGIPPDIDPVFHIVTAEPPPGFTIRLIGFDGTTEELMSAGALDTTTTNFDKRVPHLQKVSKDTLTDTALDIRIFDPYPDRTDYAAFFELEGGTFDATPYCKKTKFKVDHEGTGVREFAEFVVLKGTLSKPPILQFTNRTGMTKNVTFSNPTFPLKLFFINLPSPAEINPQSHFPMYKRLGADPANLTWDDVVRVECKGQGPIPGCSNTQWP